MWQSPISALAKPVLPRWSFWAAQYMTICSVLEYRLGRGIGGHYFRITEMRLKLKGMVAGTW